MATVKGAWGESYEVDETTVVEETPVATTTETPVEVTTEVTPTVVTTEQVETPAAEITPTAEPVVKEVIKEVEKIVEKYPEMDEHTKQIFDALMEGKEETIYNYLSEKNKNYGTMSDYDVVRENLKKSNPSWSPEEVELEVRYKYGEKLEKYDLTEIDKETDPEVYAQAVKHNREVENNEVLLKRDARDARIALEQAKKEIKLPKIEQPTTEQVPQQTAEQIEQGRRDWLGMVEKGIKDLQDFTFKVGDADSGYEDIAFKITDEQKKEQETFLSDLDVNKLVKRFGWVDENGVQNVSKMAGDVLKLENINRIAQAAYSQGKTTGSKGTIAEIKNLDLSKDAATSVQATSPDIGQVVWGHLNPK